MTKSTVLGKEDMKGKGRGIDDPLAEFYDQAKMEKQQSDSGVSTIESHLPIYWIFVFSFIYLQVVKSWRSRHGRIRES